MTIAALAVPAGVTGRPVGLLLPLQPGSAPAAGAAAATERARRMPYEHPAWTPELSELRRTQWTAQLRSDLDAAVLALVAAGAWERMLTATFRPGMLGLSWQNRLRVLLQRPGATWTMSYLSWQRLGRQAASPGLGILKPLWHEDQAPDSEPYGYRLSWMFDVAQTVRAPGADPIALAAYAAARTAAALPARPDPQALRERLEDAADRHGARLRPGPVRDLALRTARLEVAGRGGDLAELVAQSAALLVCHRYGVAARVRALPTAEAWGSTPGAAAQKAKATAELADQAARALLTPTA